MFLKYFFLNVIAQSDILLNKITTSSELTMIISALSREGHMTQTEQIFVDFLSRYSGPIKDLCHVPIEETDLYEHYAKFPLKLTHFDDIYDTLMYSRLIQKAIELHEDPEVVMDLGAGSSIPSLLAVKQSGKHHVKAFAVDIDPDAKNIGEHNARTLGLESRYTFIPSRLEAILQQIDSPKVIVVSNPPYIPAPETISDFHFVPINGGDDGTRYMLPLLQHNYAKGSIVAFLWGSLTNPSRVLPLIEERFEVLHVEAMKIHLGKYTRHPEIYSYLCKLRDEDKVLFGEDDSQYVIGTILRAK